MGLHPTLHERRYEGNNEGTWDFGLMRHRLQRRHRNVNNIYADCLP